MNVHTYITQKIRNFISRELINEEIHNLLVHLYLLRHHLSAFRDTMVLVTQKIDTEMKLVIVLPLYLHQCPVLRLLVNKDQAALFAVVLRQHNAVFLESECEMSFIMISRNDSEHVSFATNNV